jgi:hypothetical protein
MGRHTGHYGTTHRAQAHDTPGTEPHLETVLERLRAVEFVDRTVFSVVLSTLLERELAPP